MNDALTVSVLQTSTRWHDPAANRNDFSDLLSTISDESRVVLLPEMFSTGFTMDSAAVAEPTDGPTIAWMKEEAAQRNIVLCGSLVVAEQGAYYNRFVAAFPDGATTTYDKRHRFRMAGEHQHYSAGAERVLFEVDGWRICPMVCYDLRFPVFFRNRGDYDVLICVANWPAARQDAWHTLLRARAIENQAYVAAANIIGTDGNGVAYRGGSAVYAPGGEVLADAGDARMTVSHTLSRARLEALREQFPVWQDADDFELSP